MFAAPRWFRSECARFASANKCVRVGTFLVQPSSHRPRTSTMEVVALTTPAGFDELHRLAGQAERFASMFSVAQDEARTFEGQDETAQVHVEVDADGRVTDVSLERDWNSTLDPRSLGTAVIEAVSAATTTRIAAWADRVAEATDEPAPETPPRAPEPVTINPSGQMIENLLYLLHRVGQETKPPERTRRRPADDYDEDYDDEAPTRRRLTKGTSDGGHVVVALDGKTVARVEVETDTIWVSHANNLEVAGELRSAFAAAYRRADDEAATQRSDSAVAELQALTADPQEFVAKLFGLDR
jgi:DNA-binding protein YbaB